MEKFGKAFSKKMIAALLTLVLGTGGVTTIINGAMSVASGSPIKDVVKDSVADAAKDKAMEALSGAISSNKSFSDPKYKYVSYGKSGIIGYWRPGWDSEVYGYGNGVFIGNRTHNNPKGMNLKWNNRNAMDFEIGNFRKDNVKSGEYIAFNSDSFEFVIGKVEKYKLNGLVLEYDEYYNTASFSKYKKGKKVVTAFTIDADNTVEYSDDNKKKLFGNDYISESDYSLTDNPDGGHTIKFDDKELNINCESDTIEYKSNYYQFSGNAYKFDCKAAIKDNVNNEWIDYDYEVANKIGITQNDGTVGEVKLASDEDKENISDDHVNIEALSMYLIKEGAHATVEILLEDKIGVINDVVEITTGESVTDRINDAVDDVIDNVADSIKDNNSSEDSETYYDYRDNDSIYKSDDDLQDEMNKAIFNHSDAETEAENTDEEDNTEENSMNKPDSKTDATNREMLENCISSDYTVDSVLDALYSVGITEIYQIGQYVGTSYPVLNIYDKDENCFTVYIKDSEVSMIENAATSEILYSK